jgi:hypothetical protein
MAENRKIVGFKKFSDIKGSPKIEEVELSTQPDTDSDRPMLPNTPEESKKIEKPMSRKNIQPKEQDINLPSEEDNEFDSESDEEKNENVTTHGKVAKFPKNVKASKAYNFLENVKVSKKSIWYIMVEKQDNELQMVKYNNKEGVDLNQFVTELKGYYLKKYSKDAKVCKMIESINVDGNDKYSMVKNIPLVTIDGRKMISIITEDLIKLLSK